VTKNKAIDDKECRISGEQVAAHQKVRNAKGVATGIDLFLAVPGIVGFCMIFYESSSGLGTALLVICIIVQFVIAVIADSTISETKKTDNQLNSEY
jgi:hypothetical protein